MILETKYGIGDVVYAAYGNGNNVANGPLTIGLVRAELIDSPGIEGETMFDNYKPQRSNKAEYMCIETGIGSGRMYYEDRLFVTFQEAQTKLNEVMEEHKRECAVAKKERTVTVIDMNDCGRSDTCEKSSDTCGDRCREDVLI